ncbi:MAG: PhnA domain-containing protein, partial [Sneathiella sp.]
SIETELQARAESKCELCGATETLNSFVVAPKSGDKSDECVLACANCSSQIEGTADVDKHHWRCLNESMWSQEPAVQVIAWRMLNSLNSEGWAQDLLDMLYLEEETLAWAKSVSSDASAADAGDVKHVDSNGAILQAGDTVTLIKDLTVKGAGFTAKRGTSVRGISLVPDNAEHIEGRVQGQQIVILTKFVKKTS